MPGTLYTPWDDALYIGDNYPDPDLFGDEDEEEDEEIGEGDDDGQPTLWDEYNGPCGLWGGEDSYLDSSYEDRFEIGGDW